ncbi:MAG: MFS transporter [Leptolyngbyaceae cyanobacterium MO_188.B28]|nr:MFS transporter [Leptolyngbyaceae cyanobacterium MO_188.B28]
MKTFFIVWLGRFVSLMGSRLTGFALSIWVYQNSESVTLFSLTALSTTLPAVLISPVTGLLVDRWDRRWIMIISQIAASLRTLAIFFLLINQHLTVWQICLLNVVASTFTSLQLPAFLATSSLLVPKQHLARVTGMTQLGVSANQIIAPMIAGALLVTIQMQGVLLVDFATFIVGICTLLAVKFPRVAATKTEKLKQGSFWREMVYGWQYIKARPGLLGLLLFFTFRNFLLGLVSVLAVPLVLSITSSDVLGIMLAISGVGMLISSLIVAKRGIPKHHYINTMFGFNALGTIAMITVGLRSSIPLVMLSGFLLFFCVPFINIPNQIIFQRKIPAHIQGRVFALRRAFAMMAMPLGYVVSGPLADRIFEPLMLPNGFLAGSIGTLIGVGPGRGIGLMFIVTGCLTLLVTLAAYQYPRLRRLEIELPDAISDDK